MTPSSRFRPRPRTIMMGGLAVVAVWLGGVYTEVPTSIDSIGRVIPAREWALVRTPSGALSATLTDHRTGASTTSFTAEPARGDAGRFELDAVALRTTVNAGDVIGSFVSEDLDLQLVEVNGLIAQARAQLALQRSGAKDSQVESARSEVERAETALERARLALDRQRRLFDAGVSAEQDVEAAEGEVRLAEADVNVATARLRVAETGGRPEAAAVEEARIDALQSTARELANRRQVGSLVVPISGRVQREFSPDTLVLVVDTTTYHLAFPVAWDDQQRVDVGQTVSVSGPGLQGVTAQVVDIRGAAQAGAGQAYLVAMAVLDPEATQRLIPGLLVRCSIETGVRRPIDIVREWFRDLVLLG